MVFLHRTILLSFLLNLFIICDSMDTTDTVNFDCDKNQLINNFDNSTHIQDIVIEARSDITCNEFVFSKMDYNAHIKSVTKEITLKVYGTLIINDFTFYGDKMEMMPNSTIFGKYIYIHYNGDCYGTNSFNRCVRFSSHSGHHSLYLL